MAIDTQTIPQQMRACQLVEFNKPHQLRDIPTPQAKDLKPHDLLLKVAVAGLCHTDLAYQAGAMPIQMPVTASHEGVGTVVMKGRDMTKFDIGDRVLAGMTYGRCGDCDVCKGPENYRHYCENRDYMMSIGRNGAFQEYLVIDGREAAKIPDEISFTTAASLACAGVTSWRATKQAQLKPGDWLGVIGSGGGLGHLMIQMAKKAMGLKVIGVEARDEGLALSRDVGADAVLDARQGIPALIEEVKKITGAGGVHATVELSGHPTGAETATSVTRNHGRVIQVGAIQRVTIPNLHFIFKDIRVSGSMMASQGEMEEMLNAVVEHKIRVENNIFNGLDEVTKVVEMLKNAQYRGKACIVIDPKAVGLKPNDARL